MSRPDSIEIRRALERELGSDVVSLRRRASAYATSHRIENLSIGLAGGRSLAVVFKDLSPASLLPAARGIRPEPLRDPQREIEVYRRLLARGAPVAPAFVAADVDVESGRYWLFLERLAARPLWEHGRFRTWLATAAALAEFHSRAARSAGALPLLRMDGAFHALWMRRAMEFRPSRSLERLGPAHAAAAEVLLALPQGLIHGECFASNILILKKTHAVRLIDWESAAVGQGLYDLAALSMGWPSGRKAALADAYAWAMGRRPHDLDRAFACARLLVAVQLLGWSRKWRAPRAHRRDWLGEACAAAREAGW